jgi:hypothetical protein
MAQTSGLPGEGTATGEEGAAASERDGPPDRRRGDGRRDADRGFGGLSAGLSTVMAAFWAIVGAAVVLFLFFVALDAIDPGEVRTLSLAVLVLAVLWMGHSWRRLFLAGSSSRADRERRGF